MLLRDNQDLFNTIKALSGVNDFTTEETQNLVDLTNRRLTMAYNTSPMWDRYVVVGEERRVADFEISGFTTDPDTRLNQAYQFTANNVNNTVAPNDYSDTAVYRGIIDQSCVIMVADVVGLGKAWVMTIDSIVYPENFVVTGGVRAIALGDFVKNPWDVTTWSLAYSPQPMKVTEGTAIVPYNCFRKPDVQDFIRIHQKRSFLNNSSTEFDFYVDSNGANLLNAGDISDNKIYVTYKKPIVDSTTGVVISSLTSGKQIPSEFFNYTAHGVYADFLRMDGQHDKAAFEEQKADMFLATELERIDIINNNNSLNHKISTYVNRSTR